MYFYIIDKIEMQKKFIALVTSVLLTLIIWIYRSSNVEFNNTVLLFKTRNYFIKNTLIEPSNFVCGQQSFLVILVTSYVGHVELRSAHRRAMPPQLLKTMNASRIFLIAKIPQNERYITQKAINHESNIFGDLLQGSFIENYRNLTFKHLMGLEWAARHCNKSSFILKVDDDTVFNLKSTYKLLFSISNQRKEFLMGYMLNNTKPRRNKENKWYVTQEEYPRSFYPPYLSGWYYITTPNVAAKLTDEAKYHPYFWIDDILITGLLTESLNIELRQLPSNYWLEYYELLECCLKDMISKSIRCDYVVGPNGGRNNLIVEFNEALKHCDIWRNCTSRNVDQPLNKVCVVYRERTIFSDGQAQVQHVKL